MLGASTESRILTGFTYNGIETAFLENRHLRIMVLPGKGGDILEFRDKRTDVDVLWHADHNWFPPNERYVPSMAKTTWMDHYPGGWQMNLPVAGFGWEIAGNAYGIHGESALIPWDATVTQDGDAVSLCLSTELNRYPFAVERTFTLPSDESELQIAESITNLGGVELEYMWQHHVALGPPLLAAGALLDVPAAAGETADYGDGFPNARLEGDTTFDWPECPGIDEDSIDLRDIPARDVESHDLLYLTELDGGRCSLLNPELDLAFDLSFPIDPFESLWYWQPFGGYEESPYFARNYNIGLEPTNAYPASNIPEAQRKNGTMKSLSAGESISVELTATTHHDMN